MFDGRGVGAMIIMRVKTKGKLTYNDLGNFDNEILICLSLVNNPINRHFYFEWRDQKINWCKT